METIKPTLKELQQKRKDIKEEEIRVDLALRLGICPVCGANIVKENDYKHSYLGTNIFGKPKMKSKHYDYIKYCSNNKTHYAKMKDYEHLIEDYY